VYKIRKLTFKSEIQRQLRY